MSKARGLADLGNAFDDGALSNRNLIINGAMAISQRNGTSTLSPAPTGYGGPDRFATYKSGSGAFSISQSSDAPVGFKNSLLATVTTSSTPSGSSYYVLQYTPEGQDFAVLEQGTSDAQDFTLSFYVKSSLTGTFSGSMRDSTTSVSYVFEYTINSANTWERKSVTIEGTSSGTFNIDNTVGGRLVFSLGQGTTGATSTVGSWVSGSYHGSTTETDFIANAGATWQITGVQLEVGDTATPFEHPRSYGDELARCQRYYYGPFEYFVKYRQPSTQTIARLKDVTFPVTMRSSPTASASNASASNCVLNGTTNKTTHSIIVLDETTNADVDVSYAADFTFDAEL